MNTLFFDSEKYFLVKKRSASRSQSQFRIYNEKHDCIGFTKQRDSMFRRFLGFDIFPFLYEIRSANGVLEASLSRGYFFFSSIVSIKNSKGEKIGYIKQRLTLFRRNLKIMNISNELIAEIQGDRKKWHFVINDLARNKIGIIDQKGERKKRVLFRACNKYNIVMNNICIDLEDKMAILSCAFAINAILTKSS